MKKHDFGKPLCRLITAVAIMLLSLQAMAQYYYGQFFYTYQGKTLSYCIISENMVEVRVSYTYNGDSIFLSGDVVIPSTVTYNGTTYSVTSIGYSAFRGCSGLTSVTIPNSVTSIGEEAFSGCSGLTSVTIPNSITSIGNRAFSNCSGLTSIAIPNSITSIGNRAFINCSGLIFVSIPNSVIVIGEGAFAYCSGLTSINVAPENTHYSSIDGVLYNYVQDTLIQCPGAKTSIDIPSSVTSIGDYAFSNCSGLTSIAIPNSVTSIGRSAFRGCSGLTSVTIPNSVTSIRDEAFCNCDNLTTLNFNAINCQDFVGSYFTTFGRSLTTVNIGDSVQRIPAYFVQDCSGLTSVSIPDCVASIGEEAFRGCSGLTSISIPSSVTYIGEEVFRGCSGLFSINVVSENTHYSSIDGVLYDYVQDTLMQCPAVKTSVTIPNSVIYIEDYAFRDCSFLMTLNFNAINCQDFGISSCFRDTPLTTVNIGDSVQRIPAYFVKDCSGLTLVSIPNSVTFIGEMAFRGCSSLTSINVVSENTHYSSIDGVLCNYVQDTLIQCPSGKTSVTIPNSVTYIDRYAFKDCNRLRTLNFNAINCQDFEYFYFNYATLTTLNIGDSVQRIPANFVKYCSSLRSVTIPNSVTSIGDYAFKECSSLRSVTIPNNVTSIGDGTFGDCSGLRSVSIGRNLTSIGYRAFDGCTNLLSLVSLATTPPTISNKTFPFPNRCGVTVPCGSLEAYTAPTCYWSVLFPQRITEGLAFELFVSANEEAYGRVEVETHSCESATLTAIAKSDYVFSCWSDDNTENPRTVTITSDTAFMAIFSPAVSLQEVNAREFALYPNPAKSFVNLEFEALKENTLLQILDLNGRRVRTHELKAGIETLRIDLGDLPKGVYTVMLGNVTKKLIVE